MKKRCIFIPFCCLLYILSFPAAGYAAFGQSAWIDGFMPSRGPDTGEIEIKIVGDFLDEYTQDVQSVRLEKSTNVNIIIQGTELTISEGAYLIDWESLISGDELTATFDLTGAEHGEYSIVVELDDSSEIYSDSMFTVGPHRDAELWAGITGQPQVRGGASTDCLIWYGNYGNAESVPSGILLIGIPKNLNHDLGFNLNDYAIQGLSINDNNTNDPIDDEYELQPLPAEFEASFNGIEYRILRLCIQDIPPLSAIPLKITVHWDTYDWNQIEPVDHLLKVWWSGGKTE